MFSLVHTILWMCLVLIKDHHIIPRGISDHILVYFVEINDLYVSVFHVLILLWVLNVHDRVKSTSIFCAFRCIELRDLQILFEIKTITFDKEIYCMHS